jgi:hypothetical protein
MPTDCRLPKAALKLFVFISGLAIAGKGTKHFNWGGIFATPSGESSRRSDRRYFYSQ